MWINHMPYINIVIYCVSLNPSTFGCQEIHKNLSADEVSDGAVRTKTSPNRRGVDKVNLGSEP